MKDTDTVYILSDVRELDGVFLPLLEALEEVVDQEFGSVVCCIPGKLAFYHPETPGSGYILECAAPSR